MTGSISILIPAIDEVVSLRKTIVEVKRLLQGRELEILVVTHPTFTTAKCRAEIARLQQEYREIQTFDQKKMGIGGAMQDCFEKCMKDYAVIMSSDLETDPATLPAMLEALEAGADVVATTRWRRGARFKGYNPIKFVLNFLFQQFFRILFLTPLTDLTFGYRIYRSEVVKRIQWEQLRFPFFLEAILKPIRLGYKVSEVETPWVARSEGVSHNSLGQTIDYVRVGLALRFAPKKSLLSATPPL